MTTRYALLLSTLLITNCSHAQIPNPGFEDWTVVGLDYEYPSGWYTLNALTFPLNVFTCQRGLPGAEGSYFVRVTTRSANGTTLPGLVSASADNSADGGFPFASRPAALNGKRQYQVAAPDQASITVQLTKWNTTTQETETIGSGVSMVSGTVSSWQDFSIPIVYLSPSTPDTARIIILSSAGTPAVNSTISVDALAFGAAVGITEQESAVFGVFPSPTTDVLTIRSDVAVLGAEVFDALGRTLPQAIRITDKVLDVAVLPAGCYTVRVRFADGTRGTRTFLKH